MLRSKAQTSLRQLLTPGAPVLVGVSGGADSVALLHVLVELGYRPHVCHLDHQWRGLESATDAEFVRALAVRLGCGVSIGRRRVGPSEAAARQARLCFFRRCARQTGITTLALAHTADDQAETVLLRLLRGAGPVGLGAMQVDRRIGCLRVVRPLLAVGRPEIIQYLTARRLAWREDPSNRDLRLLRNRVRHVLLPLLEREFNPAIKRVLCRTAAVLQAEQGQEAAAWQRREIRRQLGALSFNQVEEVRKRLDQCWPVQLPGITRIAELGLVLEVAILPAGYRPGGRRVHGARAGLPVMECFDADRLGCGLHVRTWRDGDRFQPLGMSGQKKLQDYFVDAKLPKAQRDRVPLICTVDGGQIAWVVGYRMAEGYKVTAQTRRVARISVRPWSPRADCQAD